MPISAVPWIGDDLQANRTGALQPEIPTLEQGNLFGTGGQHTIPRNS